MRRGWWKDAYAFVALFSLWDGDGLRDALSWWGFGAISVLLLITGIVVTIRHRRRFLELITSIDSWPIVGFIALCLLSTVWSAYPVATLLGFFIQIATALVGVSLLLIQPPGRLVAIGTWMVHVHLALSLMFEAVVALFVPGHQLLPFWTDYGSNAPGAYYWSEGLLFKGGRIQGIVANANLTCFLALLGLVLIGCLLAARRVPMVLAVPAVLLDLLMLALTRSATVLIAGFLVVAAALVVIGFRRFRGRGRIVLAAAAAVMIGIIGFGSSRASAPLLGALGKGDDLTGRLEIWRVVGDHVAERPVLGWGWVGYWPPWVAPFNRLIVRGGVQYLQAHNAYLDIALQLGIPGLLAFVVVVGSLVYRSLRLAIAPRPLALLPLLLTVALLTQALAESRLLIEGNWALLVMLSVAVPWVGAPLRPPVAVVSPQRGDPVPAPRR
ncbi:O-antigen ligase family protein [Amnibacterium sp.]|uniref:O-antigen ligase family protein n=1 Tax=Amnibacterium sp. TaxID=1872496 RepID=UPI00260EA7A0|nr:O-antigen ligase family protein [Amnibacterium sp.]MCU1473157.1 exopolysaccharide production protein [Amnibacterium sp.]